MAEMPVTTKRKDVDDGWAWMVLLASFMNMLMASGIAFVSGIFQKLFLEEFGESIALTAWVTALFSSFMQLAGPLSGLLTSVTNCRTTVMIGGALLAVGLAVSSFATSLTFLFVTFGCIAGIGLGLMYTPSIVIVNFFFDRRRTVIMGLALSASGIGIIGAPVLSRFLIDQFTWREALAFLAGVCAHICVFGAIMFPMHEPVSRCHLRACRRGRGIQQKVTIDSQSASDQTPIFTKEERSLALSPDSASTEQGDGPGDIKSDHASFENAKLENSAVVKSDGTHENPEADRCIHKSKEYTCLLETTDKQENGLNEVHTQTTEHKTVPEIHFIPQSTDFQFGSRNSLSKISHHLSSVKTQDRHEHGRHFSQSAHSIDRLHASSSHSHHHPSDLLKNTLARSLLNADGKGSSSGSRLDVRAISTYSSIQSLHSLGLPMVKELLAVKSDVESDAGVEDDVGERAADGDGNATISSEWMIFKNVPFLILCLNLFLYNMSCGIFNIHLPAFSQQRGLNDHDITFILAMHGLSLFVSRILVGALGHDHKVDKLAVFFGLHLIAAFLQVCLPFTKDLKEVTVLSILVGIYLGSVYSLLTSLTISVVGLSSLAFSFGVEMVFAGLGFLVAPPLAGWIVDETGDYNNSMYLAAFVLFLSALTLLCLTFKRPPGSPSIGYNPIPPEANGSVHLEEDGEVQRDSNL